VTNPFTPLLRAFGQLDDPAFLGVLLRSVAWCVLVFAALFFGASWGVHHALLSASGWLRWPATVLGAAGSALLALWLFVPVAAGIAALYTDRVAAAVERRWHPAERPPEGAPLAAQVWDGIALGLRVLWLNVISLLLALLLPGLGLPLGLAITAWALGRGLFMAVAMRRMSRAEAQRRYQRQRGIILLQGGVLAIAGLLPPLNLLIPVIGAAAMTHVMHQYLADEISTRG
jgi:uncharacterized protein involved in cysteine biosynthesis